MDRPELDAVQFVPFRVRDGDEASCLNLAVAPSPRLVGVDGGLLAERGAFTFAKGDGWNALTAGQSRTARL